MGSDYTPGDSIPVQNSILGDADAQSNDTETTSAKLDAEDKRDIRARTSAKVDGEDQSDDTEGTSVKQHGKDQSVEKETTAAQLEKDDDSDDKEKMFDGLDAYHKSDDSERTSAKKDAVDQSDNKQRKSNKQDTDDNTNGNGKTLAKIDADHPEHKNPVKNFKRLKARGKDGLSDKKDPNLPRKEATVKRKNSPQKEDKEFAPVIHMSRDVEIIQDRRKGEIHTRPQDQDNTASVNYPLYEDNFHMDNFGSYPIYDQQRWSAPAGQKAAMQGHQDYFQTQVMGQQDRVSLFGRNFPPLANHNDENSLTGSLNGLDDVNYPQTGQPDVFDFPLIRRKGGLAPLQGGTYPQHGKPLSWRRRGNEPMESGTYPQLVVRSNYPVAGRNDRQVHMAGGTYPQIGRPDRPNPHIYEQNRGLVPLEGDVDPQPDKQDSSPLSWKNGELAPFEGGSYHQLGKSGESYSPINDRYNGLAPLEDGTYPQLVKLDRSISPISWRHGEPAPLEGVRNVKLGEPDRFFYPQMESKYDKYRRGLTLVENFHVVGSQDNINYFTSSKGRHYPTDGVGGQNGIGSQFPRGGNYPQPENMYGLSGNQILPRRQSGRGDMANELLKRNTLWN